MTLLGSTSTLGESEIKLKAEDKKQLLQALFPPKPS